MTGERILSQIEPHPSHSPHAGLLLPRTEQLVKRVGSLPTGAIVSPDGFVAICRNFLHGAEVPNAFGSVFNYLRIK